MFAYLGKICLGQILKIKLLIFPALSPPIFIFKSLCLYICYFLDISVLHPILIVLRKYYSLTWKVPQDVLPMFFMWFLKSFAILIHEFGHQGISFSSQKPEVIYPWISPRIHSRVICWLGHPMYKVIARSISRRQVAVKLHHLRRTYSATLTNVCLVEEDWVL